MAETFPSPEPHGTPAAASRHLHLVSDSTGETLDHVARACLAQFDGVAEPERHSWPLIRTERQMGIVCAGITARPGLVLFTVINEDLRKRLVDHCRALGVQALPVLEPVMGALSAFLQSLPAHQPGRQHALGPDYYARIEAMEYALACDDGQKAEELVRADVIVLGVSRTSKTPTCIYLANRGLFAANIPIVPGIPLPPIVAELTQKPIIMLTREAASLMDIRRARLRQLSETGETSYAARDAVEEEVRYARRLAADNRWPVIDVTRRSIEETAAEILLLLQRRAEQARAEAELKRLQVEKSGLQG